MPKRPLLPATHVHSGALVYDNWQLAKASPDAWGIEIEHYLFTDAHIVDVCTAGPYEMLFTGAIWEESPRPSHTLRIQYHLRDDGQDKLETKADRYTGMWLPDEWAALLSLSLGVRVKAGGSVREFRPGEDPRGLPLMLQGRWRPPPIPLPHTQAILPGLPERPASLTDPALLTRFHEVSPTQSVALVKAARSYQEAIWNVEAEPEQTWLRLVAAVEAAAVEWDPLNANPVERFRLAQPQAADLLTREGGEALLGSIAGYLAPYMGATRKFLDFLTTFRPEPPTIRPDFGLYNYENIQAYQRGLKRIYDYRSRALHAGTPVPRPMCLPPMRWGDGQYIETSIGLASSSFGSTWAAEDLPMMLHTFEHIVRGALLGWWQSLVLPTVLPSS